MGETRSDSETRLEHVDSKADDGGDDDYKRWARVTVINLAIQRPEHPASEKNLPNFCLREAHKVWNGNECVVSFRRWREFIRVTEVAQKSSANSDPSISMTSSAR